jgi:hypothetical protein
VLEGLRGKDSIAELCRREGLALTFFTAGRRNSWKPARSAWRATPPGRATSDEVKGLRREGVALKEGRPDPGEPCAQKRMARLVCNEFGGWREGRRQDGDPRSSPHNRLGDEARFLNEASSRCPC